MHLLGQYGDDDDDDGGKDVKTASAGSSSSSSSSAAAAGAAASSFFASKKLNAAPQVELELRMDSYIDPTTKSVYHNPTVDQLYEPLSGPTDPSNRESVRRNTVTGYIEPSAMNEHVFHENFHTFQTFGYAINPSDSHVAGAKRPAGAIVLSNNTYASSASLSSTKSSATSSDASASAASSSSSSSAAAAGGNATWASAAAAAAAAGAGPGSATAALAGKPRKRMTKEEKDQLAAEAPVIPVTHHRTKVSHELVSTVSAAAAGGSQDFADLPSIYSATGRLGKKKLLDAAGNERERIKLGKEAYDPSDVENFKGSWSARFKDEVPEAAAELTDEQKAYIAAQAEKNQKVARDGPSFDETTTFHGKEEKDYQGRTYMHPPGDQKTVGPDHKCFIPKKWIHTWSGHSKGVQKIEWFPKTGHLLLSGSMDHTVKIWDVYNNKKCLRTYSGHQEAVRDMCFTNDGSRFLTASYDKYVKLWDTETGQVISRHTTKKIPYCVKFHPEKQDEFLVGQSNKKIVQWDVRATEVSQSYDEHLGPVNSVNFIDNNRRFVSSADDKKIFIWEYGIPVVIKHISEPDMHSMPYVGLHPSGKFFCGQSQDNQILVYSAINRFKVNKKKHFVGHKNAGFAAQISFSPDGRFLISGDAEGRTFFWDWQTSKCYKKLKCHDQVTIGCVWHPVEPSWVATCSWDGTIKLWD